MIITENCIGCGHCLPYCPQGAISLNQNSTKKQSVINNDLCVECGLCIDSQICAVGALQEDTSKEGEIKRLFGRMVPLKEGKKKSGRVGSWDVKTCDAGRELPKDFVIVRAELGRPSGCLTISQAENLRSQLNSLGYIEESQNAYKKMQELAEQYHLTPADMNFRVLSVCLEYQCIPSTLPTFCKIVSAWALQYHVTYRLNVLFSPALLPTLKDVLQNNSLAFAPRCKCNLGLAHKEDNI